MSDFPSPSTPSLSVMPARAELFADPAAAIVWPAILALDEAGQHELLEQLSERLAMWEERPDWHAQRVARAVQNVREAAGLCSKPHLSIDSYMVLRTEHGRDDWLAEDAVRRILSPRRIWPDVLRACRLPVGDEFEGPRPSVGRRFTAEEMIAALKACAADLNLVPSCVAYRRWTTTDAARNLRIRMPLSYSPFQAEFGGWLGALKAAELVEAADQANVRVLRSVRDWTNEDIRVAIREVADGLGRPPLRREYRLAYEQSLRDMEAGTRKRNLPHPKVIEHRYRQWPAVLEDAGLDAALTFGRRSHARFPKQVIVATIQQCGAELGSPLTATAFSKWSKQKRQSSAGNVPGIAAVQTCFGGWAEAVTETLGPDWLVPINRSGGRRSVSADECTDALRACAQASGTVPSNGHYTAWAAQQNQAAKANGNRLRPTAQTIRRKIGDGSWSAAIYRALARD